MRTFTRNGSALLAVLAMLGLAVSVSACGVPTSASPDVVGSVPVDVSAKLPVYRPATPPPCTPGGSSCVSNDIYFVAAGKNHLVGVPTQANTPAELLKALFAGPTPSESAEGIVTLLPPGAAASIVSISDVGVVTINLNATFGNAGLLEIAQIVWTLVASPITGVQIDQFGAPAYVPTQNQVYAVRPLTSKDYSKFCPGCRG